MLRAVMKTSVIWQVTFAPNFIKFSFCSHFTLSLVHHLNICLWRINPCNAMKKKKAITKYPSMTQGLPGAFQGNKNSVWNATETDSSPSPRIHLLEKQRLLRCKTISSHIYTHTQLRKDWKWLCHMFDMLEMWHICEPVGIFCSFIWTLQWESGSQRWGKQFDYQFLKSHYSPNSPTHLGWLRILPVKDKELYRLLEKNFCPGLVRCCEKTKPHRNSIFSAFYFISLLSFIRVIVDPSFYTT